MAVADYYPLVQTLYVSYFGRPADPIGLDNFSKQLEALGAPTTLAELNVAARDNAGIKALVNTFSGSQESADLYGTGSTLSFVRAIYENLLNRAPDTDGLKFWVNAIEGGGLSRADASLAIADATASNTTDQGKADAALIKAKVAVAGAFTTSIDTADEFEAYQGAAAIEAARDLMATVTGASTPANTQTQINTVLEQLVEGTDGGNTSFTLTDGIDKVSGNAQDNVFAAPVVQNQNGELVNTLETGDSIQGGAGVDTLNAVLTNPQGTDGGVGQAPAISAITNGVEVVNFRSQYFTEGGVNGSNIDAELMAGVTQYWSDNSRTGLQIEDVRQLPEELTFGMRQTDPAAGLNVYFDPAQLADGRSSAGDSTLTLTLVDNANPTAQLANFPVNGVVFKLGGVQFTVTSEAIGNAKTYVEFEAALEAALTANAALAGVTAAVNANNTITLTDAQGRSFEAVGYTWVDNIVPSGGNLAWNQQVGAAVQTDLPIETDVVLDAVGRTAQGGSLDIGSMADGGVATFNVSVDRSSWLTAAESREDFGAGDRHLETVNLTSIGAKGNLAVGSDTDRLDERVVAGLTDVRQVLNKGFEGKLNIGVVLTGESVDRYLAAASGEVQFTYEGGAGADNYTIVVDDALSEDSDFALDAKLGAGDDRLNISVETASNVVVDGGTGSNTIAVARSHGTNAQNTFEGFTNFATYEVEATTNTEHDFTSMVGVTRAVVATEGVVNTVFTDLETAAAVEISGKNQTRQALQSNADQAFGEVHVLGAEGAALTVTLSNTARSTGELTVNRLLVDAAAANNLSAVRTLNIVSNGARDTANFIGDVDAKLVNTFNLTGTQNLTLAITDAANFDASNVNSIGDLVVTGAALTGDLDLSLASGLVTAVDLTGGETVTLTGTAGTADRVTFTGGALDTSENTGISAFETVRFVTADGEFDATNVSGVTLYDIESTTGDLELIELNGQEPIRINTDVQGDVAGDNLTFSAEGESSANSLNLQFRDLDTAVDTDVDTAFGVAEIRVQNYRTISLDLGSAGTVDEAYTFDFDLLDQDGRQREDGAYEADSVYARSLVVTGGGDQGAAGDAGGVDSVDLGTVTNVLSDINFGGFVGRVTAALDVIDVALADSVDRNTIVTVNGYGLDFTETTAGTDSHITTFKFTVDAVADTEDWIITGFDAFGVTDLQTLSILDLSALGVEGLADLNIADDGAGNTVVTSNDNLDFQIILNAVAPADLSNENFRFA
ncbi:beta strand repeat-containing protein [Pseudoduganella albidiflava]|uniref:DUF4214 domain-containing protein n=1 Tax=Pseudoduganella albidiflava TaxID=321983 RepID=A0A411WTW9_9BURK|nr:DUF4214 domain-containing protein [Pseudoduganella albidiflava]QBH99936.1 DUF4214 domain-containing protein [Pseudoduganella albidiflava]GGY54994.1 hypothetical protein GCM10007387_41790 [Pseudoduganella albidiflava]